MSISTVLLPVFVQIALTFGLLVWTGMSRRSAIVDGQTRVADVALGQSAWPERPTQIGRSFPNQLETPMLFYVLTALAIITQKADLLFVVMAWLFVLTRLAHAYVHVTSNHMNLRFKAFLAAVAVLLTMWTIFAVRVLGGF